jgi:protein-L-isoaspartate O-methyltransferase
VVEGVGVDEQGRRLELGQVHGLTLRPQVGYDEGVEVPKRVETAMARAATAGLTVLGETGAGRLLATLAAGVPEGGRVLELGTGAGVGTAWIVEGVGERADVEVVSVDRESLAGEGWPAWVQFVVGDPMEALGDVGAFDIVVADVTRTGEWVRQTLLHHPGLLAIELDLAGGVILCTRR